MNSDDNVAMAEQSLLNSIQKPSFNDAGMATQAVPVSDSTGIYRHIVKPKTLAEIKQESLLLASDEKKRSLDQEAFLLDKANSLDVGIAELQAEKEADKGKLVSTADLRYGNAWDETKNTVAGMLDTFTERIGNIATAPGQAATLVNEAFTTPEARDAYYRYKRDGAESLSTKDWDALGTTLEEASKGKGFFQDVLLDSMEVIPGFNLMTQPFKTNFDRLQDNDELRAQAKQVKNYIQTELGNEAGTKDLTKDIEKVFETKTTEIDAIREDFVAGKYAQATKAIKSLTPSILEGISKAVGSNKMQAIKMALEESPDFLMNLFGGGVLLSGMESGGRAGEMKADALKAFREREGRAPNSKELGEINAFAAAYGSLDLLGELLPMKGVTDPLTKMFAKSATKAAESSLKSLAKGTGKVVANVGAGAVEEGTAELGQGIIEGIGDLSDLTTEELKQAGVGSAIGSIVGGTLAGGVDVAKSTLTAEEKLRSKVVTKAKETKTKIDEKVAEVERAPDADHKEDVAVASQETDEGKELYAKSIDPTNKEVSPKVALDVLAQKLEDPDLTPEELTSLEEERKAVLPAIKQIENDLIEEQSILAEEQATLLGEHESLTELVEADPSKKEEADSFNKKETAFATKLAEYSSLISDTSSPLKKGIAARLNPDTPTSLKEAVPDKGVVNLGSDPKKTVDNVVDEVTEAVGEVLGSGPKLLGKSKEEAQTQLDGYISGLTELIKSFGKEPELADKITKVQNLVKEAKGMLDVSEEIIRKGFKSPKTEFTKKHKSSDAYAKDISNVTTSQDALNGTLSPKSIKKLQKDIQDLITFARGHGVKARTFAAHLKGNPTEADKQDMEVLSDIKENLIKQGIISPGNKEYGNRYNIHKGSHKIVSEVQTEAKYLEQQAKKSLAEVTLLPQAQAILEGIDTKIGAYASAVEMVESDPNINATIKKSILKGKGKPEVKTEPVEASEPIKQEEVISEEPPTPTEEIPKESITEPLFTKLSKSKMNGRLAYTNKANKIFIQSNPNKEEFFNYIQGKIKSESSKQKQRVFDTLSKAGYTIDFFKKLLNNNKKIEEFLYFHEKSHVDNKDTDIYFKNGKNLLTQDKLDIEYRAMIDAVKALEDKYGKVPVPPEQEPTKKEKAPEAKAPVSDISKTKPLSDSLTETVNVVTEETFKDGEDFDKSIRENTAATTEEAISFVTRINPIRQWFKSAGKSGLSILQTVGDYFNFNENTGVITEKFLGKDTPLTKDQKAFLGRLKGARNRFVEGYLKSVRKIDPKNPNVIKYHQGKLYEDKILYLTDADGNFDPNTLSTIAVSAYKWIATEGTGTLSQDDRSTNELFGNKGSKTAPPAALIQMASKLGDGVENLSSSLGASIRADLNLIGSNDMPSNIDSQFDKSLGMAAITMLVEAGLIEATYVPLSAFQAMTAYAKDHNDKHLKDMVGMSKTYSSKMKNPVLFYRMKTVKNKETGSYDIPPNAVSLIDDFKTNRELFTELFTKEGMAPTYTRKKPPESGVKRKGGRGLSKFSIAQAASDMLSRYERQAYDADNAVFDNWIKLPKDIKRSIMGYYTPEQINAAHITERDGMLGKNLSIDSEIESLDDYIKDTTDNHDGDFSKPIYFKSRFISNFRNMISSSTLNPQASKLHRFTLAQKAWKDTIDLSDKKQRDAYFLAIGLGLGFEPSKMGGQPAVIKAVEGIAWGNNLSPKEGAIYRAADSIEYEQESALLIAGVKAGGEAVHSYASIVELSKVIQNPPFNGTVETSIPNEVDGLTNGPAIAMLQLLSDPTQITNDMLNKFGYFVKEKDGTTVTPDIEAFLAQNNDAYQSIGQGLVENKNNLLQEAKKTVNAGKRSDDKGEFDRAKKVVQSLEPTYALLKEDIEVGGVLTKMARNLAKNPLMVAIYGAGEKSISNAIISEYMRDSIYGRLASFVNEDGTINDVAGLENFIRNLREVTNAETDELFVYYEGKDGEKYSAYPTGKPIPVTLKDLKKDPTLLKVVTVSPISKSFVTREGKKAYFLSPIDRMTRNIKANLASPLFKSIEDNYSNQIHNRSIFNAGLAATANFANLVYQRKYKELLEAQDEKVLEGYKGYSLLSKDTHNELVKEMGKLFPKVKLNFSEANNLDTFKDMGEWEGDRLYDDRRMYIQQKNNRGGIKARTEKAVYKNKGVAPMVIEVQSIDGSTMLNYLGDITKPDVLNVHDAGIGKATDIFEIANGLNTSFFDINKGYSMAEESAKAIADTFNLLNMDEFDQKNDDPISKEYLEAIEPVLNVLNLIDMPPETYGEMKQLISDFVKTSNNVADHIKGTRELFFNSATHVSQFALTGGELDTSTGKLADEDIDLVVKGLNAVIEKQLGAFQESVDGRLSSGPESENGPERLSNEALEEDRLKDPSVKDIESKVNKAQWPSILQTLFKLEENTTAQTDTAHQNYLTNLVAKIQNSLPQSMFFNAHIRSEGDTSGSYYPSSNLVSVTVSTSAHTRFLSKSASEVLAHELSHGVTLEALIQKPELAKSIGDFLQFLLDQGMDYTMFLEPGVTYTDDMIQIAKDNFDYFTKYSTDTRPDTTVYLRGNAQPYANVLAEFVAYGMTNAKLRSELEQRLPRGKGSRKIYKWGGKNLLETLSNIFSNALNIVLGRFYKLEQAGSALEEFDSLATALYHADVKARGAMEKAINKAERLTQMPADKINTYVANKLNRLKTYGRVMNMNPAISTVTQKARDAFNEGRSGIITSIVTQARGVSHKTANLHSLLARGKDLIDTVNLMEKKKVIKGINDFFSKPLSPRDNTSLTKGVLDIDLVALRANRTNTELASILTDESTRTSLIGALKQTIRKYTKDVDILDENAKALGWYMVHGTATIEMLQKNADLILHHSGAEVENGVDDAELVKAVDQLATLYGIQYSKPEAMSDVANLLNNESEAMDYFMNQVERMNKDSRSILFQDNPMSMQKGYTPTVTNPSKGLVYGADSQEAELRAQGYVKTSEVVRRDRYDSIKDPIHVYVAKSLYANDMNSGVAQMKQTKTKGFNIMGNTAVTLTQKKQNKDSLIRAKEMNNRVRKGNPNFDPSKVTRNYMIPKYDTNAEIIDFGYEVKKEHSDRYLEANYHADNKLGVLQGKLATFNTRQDQNTELIQELKDYMDKERAAGKYNPKAYIEIGPNAATDRGKEIWNMLPYEAKQDVKRVWGSSNMAVPVKLADLSFGYKKYSISEMLNTPGPDQRFYHKMFIGFANKFLGADAAHKLKTVEAVLRKLTSMAKNNIIVKTFFVSAANYMSNIAHLRTQGISMTTILKGIAKSTRALIQYQRAVDKLSAIEFELESKNLAKDDPTYLKLEEERRKLINTVSGNPVKHLVESGLVQTIVDDIDVSETNAMYPTYIEKQIEKVVNRAGKVIPLIPKIGKQGYMTEDTSLYSLANNLVKLTDFSARYVMYEHITKNGRIGHDEAVATVRDEYVNFDLPTHKTLQYLNDIGLVWFSNYFIGIQKVIMKTFSERAGNAIMTMIAGSLLDVSNIYDSIPLINKNMLNMISDPFSGFFGSISEIFTINATTDAFK